LSAFGLLQFEFDPFAFFSGANLDLPEDGRQEFLERLSFAIPPGRTAGRPDVWCDDRDAKCSLRIVVV
jgi:hypothetical protein